MSKGPRNILFGGGYVPSFRRDSRDSRPGVDVTAYLLGDPMPNRMAVDAMVRARIAKKEEAKRGGQVKSH